MCLLSLCLWFQQDGVSVSVSGLGKEEVRRDKKEKFELEPKSYPSLIGIPETIFLLWKGQKDLESHRHWACQTTWDCIVPCFWLWVFGRRVWVLPAQHLFSFLIKITWLFFLWETNLLLVSVPLPGPGRCVGRPGNQRVSILWPQWLVQGWQYDPNLGQQVSILMLLLALFSPRDGKLWGCKPAPASTL